MIILELCTHAAASIRKNSRPRCAHIGGGGASLPVPGSRPRPPPPGPSEEQRPGPTARPGPARGPQLADGGAARVGAEVGGRGSGPCRGPGETAAASARPRRGRPGGGARTLTTPCRRRPRRCTRGWCSAAPRRTPARGPSRGPRPPPPPPCWLPGRRSRRAGLDAPRPLLGPRRASRGTAPPPLQPPPLARREEGDRRSVDPRSSQPLGPTACLPD